MKVEITDLYYVIGAEGDEAVKIEYSLIAGGLRIVGRMIVAAKPLEEWNAAKVEAVVEEDLRKRADTIRAIKSVAQNYKGQEIDIAVEDLFEAI